MFPMLDYLTQLWDRAGGGAWPCLNSMCHVWLIPMEACPFLNEDEGGVDDEGAIWKAGGGEQEKKRGRKLVS